MVLEKVLLFSLSPDGAGLTGLSNPLATQKRGLPEERKKKY